MFAIYYFFVYYFARINLLSIIFPSIIFIIFTIKNLKNHKQKKSKLIYLILVFIDLFLIIYNCIHKNLPFTNVDWINYDYFALNALNSSHSLIGVFNNAIDFFTGIVAIIYKLFGADIKIIYFYILPCSQILSYYVYKCIFLLSKNEKKSSVGSILILLYPVNFIFSLSVLREIPIQMVLTISIYYIILFLQTSKTKDFVIASIFVIIACLMHSGVVGVFIAYIYAFFQQKFSKKIKYFNIKAIILSLIIIFILLLTPIGNQMIKRFNKINSVTDIVDTINSQNTILEANTQYITSNSSSIFDIILTLPYRYVMFILAPFIWQVYSFGTILSFIVDSIPRLIIVFNILFLLKNSNKMEKNDRKIFIILMIGIFITDLIFSLGCNNYGQAMRHRSKILPLELIIIISLRYKIKGVIENEKNRNSYISQSN